MISYSEEPIANFLPFGILFHNVKKLKLQTQTFYFLNLAHIGNVLIEIYEIIIELTINFLYWDRYVLNMLTTVLIEKQQQKTLKQNKTEKNGLQIAL